MGEISTSDILRIRALLASQASSVGWDTTSCETLRNEDVESIRDFPAAIFNPGSLEFLRAQFEIKPNTFMSVRFPNEYKINHSAKQLRMRQECAWSAQWLSQAEMHLENGEVASGQRQLKRILLLKDKSSQVLQHQAIARQKLAQLQNS